MIYSTKMSPNDHLVSKTCFMTLQNSILNTNIFKTEHKGLRTQHYGKTIHVTTPNN